MRFDKVKTINFLEFIAIFLFLVLPPMINSERVELPTFPKDYFQRFLFIIMIVFRASFEELLYRVYLPFRLKSFYSFDDNEGLRFNRSFFFIIMTEFLPLLLFAIAHRYLGLLNVVYAFFMGGVFRFIYVYFQKKIANWQRFAIIASIHSLHNLIVVLFFSFL